MFSRKSVAFVLTAFVAGGVWPMVVAGQAAPQPATAGQAAPQPAGPADGVSDQYLIGPGDQLQIFVWDHPELTVDVQVRPDGRVSAPLVEDLQAAGKRPTQLARDVEAVLSSFVRTPVVTIIVTSFIGDVQQQIRVVGQAAQARALQYRQGMTVLDVIIEVGGLSELAAGNRAEIVREVSGKSQRIRVRLKDLLNKGKMTENVSMQPGDILIIPQSVL